jgi:hypothetical protein
VAARPSSLVGISTPAIRTLANLREIGFLQPNVNQGKLLAVELVANARQT